MADADIVLAAAGAVEEGVATVGDTAIFVEVLATVGAGVAVGSEADSHATPANPTKPIMISPNEMPIQLEGRVAWKRLKTSNAINCQGPYRSV